MNTNIKTPLKPNVENALRLISDPQKLKNLKIPIEDYLNKWNKLRITSKSHHPTPTPIISINNESIGTAGNIIAISGIQKSGKSSFSNIILSGAIRGDVYDGVPKEINIKVSKGEAIIHIDTEQAKHKHLSNLKNGILKRIEKKETPEYFYSYNIRGIEISKAIELLKDVCKGAYKKHKAIHSILIDGIADFIKDVNDPEASNEIVKQLEHLATEYNTLIIVVIHRNPSDNKVRGHLGSNLLRKCESVIAIKKENDCSYIDPEELRNCGNNDIPKYLFKYDKSKGYHINVGISNNDTNTDPIQQLKNIAEDVFKEVEYLQRKELLQAISKHTNTTSENAQKKIKKMAEYEIIIQVDGKRGAWELAK